ncbi:hypothetical protein R3P38DRAFT_1468948 [Favolaschia claudopus]|uniref:Uncharacterized protein n=1 Tax=Favolaschia claudopus TaxID=2862362 RepID=A0AAW0DSC9_9AGAR
MSFAGNEEFLASMIASRWWSDADLASRCTAPPAIAQWSEITLGEGGRNDHFEYSSSFRAKMDDLRRTGLPVTIVSST